MLVYKLTNQHSQTYNNTQWGVNVTHKTNGKGELCTKGWLHFYNSPELAILMNPIHARFSNPKMWLAEAGGKFKDDFGIKGGCTKLTTLREIPVPVITETQKIAFGILCALEVCDDKEFQKWANNWLENKDRTEKAAMDAMNVLSAMSHVPYAAVYAAYAAMNELCAARYVALAADVRNVPFHPPDFQKIIEKALTY